MKIHPEGKVQFDASPDTDVDFYKLYYAAMNSSGSTPETGDPGDPTYDWPSAKVDLDSVANDKVTVDLAKLELGHVDGDLKCALVAVDKHGNESDFSQSIVVPFDNVAPAAPSNPVFIAPN